MHMQMTVRMIMKVLKSDGMLFSKMVLTYNLSIYIRLVKLQSPIIMEILHKVHAKVSTNKRVLSKTNKVYLDNKEAPICEK